MEFSEPSENNFSRTGFPGTASFKKKAMIKTPIRVGIASNSRLTT